MGVSSVHDTFHRTRRELSDRSMPGVRFGRDFAPCSLESPTDESPSGDAWPPCDAPLTHSAVAPEFAEDDRNGKM